MAGVTSTLAVAPTAGVSAASGTAASAAAVGGETAGSIAGDAANAGVGAYAIADDNSTRVPTAGVSAKRHPVATPATSAMMLPLLGVDISVTSAAIVAGVAGVAAAIGWWRGKKAAQLQAQQTQQAMFALPALQAQVAQLQAVVNAANRGTIADETITAQLAQPHQLTWAPLATRLDNQVHINGDTKSMSEWVTAADRARYLRAGAMAVVGNLPISYFFTHLDGQHAGMASAVLAMGSLVSTIGSLYGTIYLSQGGRLTRFFHELFPSGFGTHLRQTFTQNDRPTSAEFAQVMSAWQRGLTDYATSWFEPDWQTVDDVKMILRNSKKIVDGVEYDLLNLMEMTPFWQPAEKSAARADLLRQFEQAGRRWSAADEHALQTIEIHWKEDSANSGSNMLTLTWLAAHGNVSAVLWVYNHARTGVGIARDVFEELVDAKNPTALGLLAVEVDNHGIIIETK